MSKRSIRKRRHRVEFHTYAFASARVTLPDGTVVPLPDARIEVRTRVEPIEVQMEVIVRQK